jgi:hypothetical protein
VCCCLANMVSAGALVSLCRPRRKSQRTMLCMWDASGRFPSISASTVTTVAYTSASGGGGLESGCGSGEVGSSRAVTQDAFATTKPHPNSLNYSVSPAGIEPTTPRLSVRGFFIPLSHAPTRWPYAT